MSAVALLKLLDLLLQLLDRLPLLLDRLLLLLDLLLLLPNLLRLLLVLQLVPLLLLLHLPPQSLVLCHQEDISIPGEIVVVEFDVFCSEGEGVVHGEIRDITRRGGEVMAVRSVRVHIRDVLPVRQVNSEELPPRVGLGADIVHRPRLVSTLSVMERHSLVIRMASSIKYFHILTIF